MRHSLPVLGWQAVRLSNAYSLDQLNTLRLEVQGDPEAANPAHAAGRDINLYTKGARRKLDALAWAVTHKLAEARATTERPPQAQDDPILNPSPEKTDV